MKNRAPFGTLFAAISLGLLAALPAAVLAGWTPRTLTGRSTSYSYQCNTSLDVGVKGDTVTAWIDEGTGLAYASVRRNGVWAAAAPIYRVPVNAPEEITEVRTCLAADGTAVAVIVLSHFERYLAFTVVKSAELRPGQTAWSAPVDLSPRASVGSVQLASSAAGPVVAIWWTPAGLMEASRTAAGAWSAPRAIPGTAPGGELTMNGKGQALLAWSRTVGTTGTISAQLRAADGTWAAPTMVATVTGGAYDIHAGIDGAGLGTVSWVSAGGTYGYALSKSRETAPGVWSAPSVLTSADCSVFGSDLSVNDAGDSAIAWAEVDYALGEYHIRSEVQTGGAAPQQTSWPVGDAGVGSIPVPTASVAPDGSAVAIGWSDDGVSQSFAAVWTPAYGWAAPALLGGALYGNTAVVDCGPGAAISAMFPASTGVEYQISFRASTYQLVNPLPAIIAISPWMARQGCAACDVTVAGRNFAQIPGITHLHWDTVDRSSDPLSLTALVGHLGAADLMAEGTHKVAVSNEAPGGGISTTSLPFLVDGSAPTTAVALTGKLGSNGWYNGTVQVKLTGTDSLTGIGTIVTRLDSAAAVTKSFAPGTNAAALVVPKVAAVSVAGDRVHLLSYKSADNVGNAEAERSLEIRIDATAPTVTGAATPTALAAGSAAGTVKISGKVTDALSGVDPAGASFTVVDEYGTCRPSGAIAIGAGGAYTVSVPLDTTRQAADLDGRTYKATIAARDLAGSVRTRLVTVTVK